MGTDLAEFAEIAETPDVQNRAVGAVRYDLL